MIARETTGQSGLFTKVFRYEGGLLLFLSVCCLFEENHVTIIYIWVTVPR